MLGPRMCPLSGGSSVHVPQSFVIFNDWDLEETLHPLQYLRRVLLQRLPVHKVHCAGGEELEPPPDVPLVAARGQTVLAKLLQPPLHSLGGVVRGVAKVWSQHLLEGILQGCFVFVRTHVLNDRTKHSNQGLIGQLSLWRTQDPLYKGYIHSLSQCVLYAEVSPLTTTPTWYQE